MRFYVTETRIVNINKTKIISYAYYVKAETVAQDAIVFMRIQSFNPAAKYETQLNSINYICSSML